MQLHIVNKLILNKYVDDYLNIHIQPVAFKLDPSAIWYMYICLPQSFLYKRVHMKLWISCGSQMDLINKHIYAYKYMEVNNVRWNK